MPLYFGESDKVLKGEVNRMVTCDGYTLYQRKNQIIIGLPQTWETLCDSSSPIVDRQLYLTTEQEACLLMLVKKFMMNDEEEE